MIGLDIKTINLEAYEELAQQFPTIVPRAASMAINDAARRGRISAKREIMKQVNFTSSYLGGEKDGRLKIKQFSRPEMLSAAIEGRFRPTSLTRFLTNQKSMVKRGRQGTWIMGMGPAKLKIDAGSTTMVDYAYLLRLRSGNLGFAIRLRKGESIRGSSKSYPIGDTGFHLLYGPSVNQVFNTVRNDVTPEIIQKLNVEFDRQFQRLLNG